MILSSGVVNASDSTAALLDSALSSSPPSLHVHQERTISSLRGRSLARRATTVHPQKEDGARKLWSSDFLSGLLAKKSSSSSGGSSSATYQGGTSSSKSSSSGNGGSSASYEGGASRSSSSGNGDSTGYSGGSNGGGSSHALVSNQSDNSEGSQESKTQSSRVWRSVISSLTGLAILAAFLTYRRSKQTPQQSTASPEAKSTSLVKTNATKKKGGFKSKLIAALPNKVRVKQSDVSMASDETENSFVSMEVYLEGRHPPQTQGDTGGHAYHHHNDDAGESDAEKGQRQGDHSADVIDSKTNPPGDRNLDNEENSGSPMEEAGGVGKPSMTNKRSFFKSMFRSRK